MSRKFRLHPFCDLKIFILDVLDQIAMKCFVKIPSDCLLVQCFVGRLNFRWHNCMEPVKKLPEAILCKKDSLLAFEKKDRRRINLR